MAASRVMMNRAMAPPMVGRVHGECNRQTLQTRSIQELSGGSTPMPCRPNLRTGSAAPQSSRVKELEWNVTPLGVPEYIPELASLHRNVWANSLLVLPMLRNLNSRRNPESEAELKRHI